MAAKGSGRVGQKGELFPPQEVREEAGLKPGDQVVYKAEYGRIEITKIPSLLKEAYSRRKFAKVSFEEFEKMTDEVLGAPSRRRVFWGPNGRRLEELA